MQSKQHVIAGRNSLRKATMEEGFNGFYPPFYPSLFWISGILFFTYLSSVALSSGMRVVEFVAAEDKKHFMDLTCLSPWVYIGNLFVRFTFENLELPGKRRKKVGEEHSEAVISWVTLPAAHILFFWLHVVPQGSITSSSCQHACLHLTAGTVSCPEARGKCPNQRGTPEKQWVYICYSVQLCRLKNLGNGMLRN